MNLTEKISAIKKLVFGSEKFEKVTAADGTELDVSAMEVGGVVTIGEAPAAAGEYTLEDGTVLVVDETGTITEIKTVEAPTEEPTDDFANKFAEIQTNFDATKNEISEMKAQFKAVSDSVKILVEIVEKLAAAPKDEPAAFSSFSTKAAETKAEQLAKVSAAIKAFKK